jgi:hypothetical protein
MVLKMKNKLILMAGIMFNYAASAEHYDYIKLAEHFSGLTELQQKQSAKELIGHMTGGDGEILNIGECSFLNQSKENKSNCIEIELYDNDSHKLIAYAPESMHDFLSNYNKGQSISIKNCKISNIIHYGLWTSVYCDIIPQQVSGEKHTPNKPTQEPYSEPNTSQGTQESAKPPDQYEGDSFSYESEFSLDKKLNNTTEKVVVSISEKNLTVKSRNVKNNNIRTLIYTKEWNVVKTINANGSGNEYSPPVKYFDFPLYPGKTWNETSVEKDIKSGSSDRVITISSTVGNWENITIPAGTFRAIKIISKTTVLNNKTGVVTKGTDLSWYSPDVGRSILSEITSDNPDGSIEKQTAKLVAYGQAEPAD